jgi:predicted nuclease of restriction endonuclease-like (RecB) superfamily
MTKRKQPNLSRTRALAPTALLSDIRRLILDTRAQVAVAINAGLTLLYWEIGERIRKDVLQGKRAGYGEEIVSALSRQLEAEFGRGFSRRNLFNMIRFAEVFPDRKIVHALSAQLGWTHFRQIIYLDDPLKRDFYAEMCRIERWSTRILEKKIQSMLFERTALSKKPAKLAEMELKQLREDDLVTPDLVFRDPYLLDFLGLKDTYAEKDLETAILREMEAFLLEMGVGFAFLERQKRISLDGDDYYLDLLFYHRRLRRLVAVELKIGDFKPADAGQMRLYLRWLDRYERQTGEEAPLGLILCAGKKEETIQLLDLDKDSIRVASYWTNVLPKQELERKLHEAVRLARTRVNQLRGLVAELPMASEAAFTRSVSSADIIALTKTSTQSSGSRHRLSSSRTMKRKRA